MNPSPAALRPPRSSTINPSLASLRTLLTKGEPLGPIDQVRIGDEAARSLLDAGVGPFRDVADRPYMLLLGRRGAGKSAMLAEIRIKRERGRHGNVFDNLPPIGEPYVLPVMSWEHFHQIVKSVGHGTSEERPVPDLTPPEYWVARWYETLWHEIILHFYNYASHPDAEEWLAPVRDYIVADGSYNGSARDEAQRLFTQARASVLAFLEYRRSDLYFLFDSMESYPIRNLVFAVVLVGMFQAMITLNAESARLHVSFCIPEELEGFIVDGVPNLLKDFGSSYRISWRPAELLRITAHRLRWAAKVYDSELYKKLYALDFSSREDIHSLFKALLPATITNALGNEEDTLAYILRHTQLLPRHMLLVFNAILSRHLTASGRFSAVSEDAVREGVGHAQGLIANNILNPFLRIYPKLITTCRALLPELDPICKYSELRKLERRFKKRIEEDVSAVWGTLFHMGIIGRVDGSGRAGRSERYCYGEFHFNIEGAFGMPTESIYCLHPVFSRFFGLVRRGGDQRVVYPANVDLVTLT